MAETGTEVLTVWTVFTGHAGHTHIIICNLGTHTVKLTKCYYGILNHFLLQDFMNKNHATFSQLISNKGFNMFP